MKTISFLVATDPKYYGSEADPQAVQEYAVFAQKYLLKQGYEQVEIEFVQSYPQGGADTQGDLRKQVWAAFRGG
jgi:hypothetical protein